MVCNAQLGTKGLLVGHDHQIQRARKQRRARQHQRRPETKCPGRQVRLAGPDGQNRCGASISTESIDRCFPLANAQHSRRTCAVAQMVVARRLPRLEHVGVHATLQAVCTKCPERNSRGARQSSRLQHPRGRGHLGLVLWHATLRHTARIHRPAGSESVLQLE